MPRRPDALPRAQRRRLRASARAQPLHPEVGADRALLAEALDVRLGYLLGAPDTSEADHGATLLTTVARGPDTRRRLERTLAGFLTEHRARASLLAPGRVLGPVQEQAVASDAVLLALLARAARWQDPTRVALLAPATAGLDDARLHALVDPRVVADVTRLLRAAEQSLWRPLASGRTQRLGPPGWWQLGDAQVLVVTGTGRAALRSVRDAHQQRGSTPGRVWLARHEVLLHLHDGRVGGSAAHDEQGAVSRPRAR